MEDENISYLPTAREIDAAGDYAAAVRAAAEDPEREIVTMKAINSLMDALPASKRRAVCGWIRVKVQEWQR